jgi:hypothetical protein
MSTANAGTNDTATRFEDWLSVQNLLFTFAELVDLGGIDEAVAMFEHATYRHERAGDDGPEPVVHRGSSEVKAAILGVTRMYPDGTPRTKHVVTNVIIELDGDTATARSYLTVMQQTDTLPLQPVASGRYLDRFERVDGTWRWADRVIRAGYLVGDISEHSLGAPRHR